MNVEVYLEVVAYILYLEVSIENEARYASVRKEKSKKLELNGLDNFVCI